jgi:hypothetical protein
MLRSVLSSHLLRRGSYTNVLRELPLGPSLIALNFSRLSQRPPLKIERKWKKTTNNTSDAVITPPEVQIKTDIAETVTLLPHKVETKGKEPSSRNRPSSVNHMEVLNTLRSQLSTGKHEEFDKTLKNYVRSCAHSPPTVEAKTEFTSLVRRWIASKHHREYPSMLRTLGALKYSAARKEDLVLIDELINKYLKVKWKPVDEFALFFTALKVLNYKWKFINNWKRNLILEIFDKLIGSKEMTGREYSEILGGFSGIDLDWNTIDKKSRTRFLFRLEEIKETIRGINLCSVLFNYGKLGINVKTLPPQIEVTFLDIAMKALKVIRDDEGKLDKGREVKEDIQY